MNGYAPWSETAKWQVVNGAVFTPLATMPVTPPPQPQIEAIAPAQVATVVPDPCADLTAKLDAAQKWIEELMAEKRKLETDLKFFKTEADGLAQQLERERKLRQIAEVSYRSLSKRIGQEQQDKSVEVSLAHA